MTFLLLHDYLQKVFINYSRQYLFTLAATDKEPGTEEGTDVVFGS